jgi:tRNA (5-methylaminomethyl-2-thiouridylate)-methyltransferase
MYVSAATAIALPCRIRMARASQKILLVMRRQKGTIAVAMSGGIDSSVAAMILKDQGYNCVGVFMRNWDSSDEIGEVACSIDRDREHMRQVCHRLDIPAVDVDFVKDYWNEVFVPFIDTYRSGSETPNPDVMCNRQIKFLRFRDHVREKLGISTIATGHYARLGLSFNEDENGGFPRLLKGSDITKDQSYFLSMTQGSSFKDVLFPIGSHKKNEVRLMAAERLKGLAVLTKKESMGVCFIGKRSMPTFLSNYMKLTPGRFIDLDTGKILGRHEGKEALTIGQGAKIGGSREKYFIVPGSSYTSNKEDSIVGDVYVCMGSNHPSLYCKTLIVRADR